MSTRRNIFEDLDALPARWGKRTRRPDGKRLAVAAALDEHLAERLAGALQTVGLNGSSLVRVGLIRVIREIERDGFVQVECLGAKPPGAPVPLPGVPDDEL